ncbi:hypothetical protein [Dactylosporangium darangshiense]|uniref:Glycoside hydrolase family 5 domain-containing protein n=1 Tax=Dactylosporangium darangshiense TaxID=579108 RepID=A0ABP8DS58_9ACTN
MNDTFRLGVVRGVSYGLFGPPGEFVPQARELGAGLVRAYLYWSQLEPEPGRFTWDAADALLTQLDGDTEVWLTVCSSSPWATRQPATFLPPSPAKDPDDYARFATALVEHCKGRIRYFQADNEPSNAGLLWSGTAAEYVTQLRALHTAVHAADPQAQVILGGCGYDVLSSPADSPARAFFDEILDTGRDAFDVFDVHLYGQPSNVPDYVAQARDMMRRHGYERPVFAGEHAGPVLFEFPELDPVVAEAFASLPPDAADLVELAGEDTPERRAMAALYARIDELPPRLQMLMQGCPGALSAKRDRIACRQLVMRTVQAMACGVTRTAYWNLAPEVPGYSDRYQMMDLMFGRLPLLDYDAVGTLTRHNAAASTFTLLSSELSGATAVSQRDGAYYVERPSRGPLWIAWAEADTFDGEDDTPVEQSLPWPSATAAAIDAFGCPVPTQVHDGHVHIATTVTPVFIS